LSPENAEVLCDHLRVRRLIGETFLQLHRLGSRGVAKAFTLLAAGGFGSFGAGSVLIPPIRITGARRIVIGKDVYVGTGSWLQTLGDGVDVAVTIGDGTRIGGDLTVSAVSSVVIGQKALIARNVYIADHMHAFDDPARAVLDQGLTRIAPVEIGDGAWLGQNVVVGPGVRIGRGAVVGSNSVVLKDIPDRCVAAGAPARVLRQLDEGAGAAVAASDSAA
jgi:acetyltransferase-like isoleucine patch superfamily enzyme